MFFQWDIAFNKPWYLLLLLVIPLLWVLSFRSMAGLGKYRRLMALGLRTIVVLAIVFCLAEVQLRKTSDKVTVIYLLDQSESIPLARRNAMLQYVVREVAKHRNAERGDRAGVIVFGRDALVEIPPFDDDIPLISRVESAVDLRMDATNIAAAMKLAQASFPEDSAKRIVLVTDGNENIGHARSVAPLLRDAAIGIDVVPVKLDKIAEVAVEKIALPPDIRLGQPVEARVVLNNYSNVPVTGTLTVKRVVHPQEELLSEEEITLKPGKNVRTLEHSIDQAAVYTYRADFTPKDSRFDLMKQNNTATAFTHVKGKGRILLIEDWENKGDFDLLVERLRANDLEVTLMPSNQLFSSLAELQAYDCVLLCNVPRSSGDTAKTVSNFTDEQIDMLVRNTQQMGAGLIMMGGPNSFGAGAWANTELEKAMPVDFQIKNAKVQAVGALVLMMHASEMAQGNYWQKVVARESIKALGPMDYCGLIHWGNTTGSDSWLWMHKNRGLIRVSGRRKSMIARLNRMTPGDMPQFDPAMQMALADLKAVKASVKHMIIISDGDPSPPRPTTISGYVNGKIQISTVAVGTHGPPGSTPLQRISQATGGKYYVVSNPKALPKIYQREARRVARPLIYEPDGGVPPQVVYNHEMHDFPVGMALPTIRGFVMTTLKSNVLVEQSIVSPKPKDRANSTILASWNYGLGRTAVLTTDAGKRWTKNWTTWEDYDKFYVQLVRWAMRPVDDSGSFTVATDFKDGKVRVVVTGLDSKDEFLNHLDMVANVVSPTLKTRDLQIRQTAPGRYEGSFEADSSGSFFITISPGVQVDEDGKKRTYAPILSGITVPYSAEYRDREANTALMSALASITPAGGKPGKLIQGNMQIGELNPLLEVDTFRHTLRKAVSSQDVWPWFVLFCACVFFADVFVRRVTVTREWFDPAWNWVRERILRQKPVDEEIEQRLDRLRSRKEAIAGQIDERRATTRFEPQMDENAEGPDASAVLEDAQAQGPGPAASPPPSGPQVAPSEGDAQDDDYTSRLMAAKKRAFKDREN